MSPTGSTWHHAPLHRFSATGSYMVTAGTYGKVHYWNTRSRLDIVRRMVLECLNDVGWEVQAWSFFSNHYHVIASCEHRPESMSRALSKAHTLTARQVNLEDGTAGRKVWYQFFETRITGRESWYARLNYVHNNPAHHGLTPRAELYPWCSATRMAQEATPAFRKLLEGIKTEQVNVSDDYDPIIPS